MYVYGWDIHVWKILFPSLNVWIGLIPVWPVLNLKFNTFPNFPANDFIMSYTYYRNRRFYYLAYFLKCYLLFFFNFPSFVSDFSYHETVELFPRYGMNYCPFKPSFWYLSIQLKNTLFYTIIFLLYNINTINTQELTTNPYSLRHCSINL